ncbi:MAG: family 10 glycosylhydrolase [Gammaproteobacteria bacterium]|nr:family 10 glycosylhydrolase [Gammaproteobacteria bacterium]
MGFQAGQHAEQAYYLAQESRPDEFVGVWMQQFGDLREWSWERIANALADHRVDALFINAVNGGYANYPSQILPHITAEGDDVIRDALAACRKVGIECHVWMMVNYVRPLTPDKFRRELLDEGRFEQSLSGGTLPFLRPSLPENVAQVTAVAREIASRYDIDGLHLDYIRYSPDGDYSDHERELFEAHLRQPLEDWPRDVQLGGRQRLAWCAWRRDNVDRQVESIVDAAREARPRIKLSAAVYPIWTDAYYKVGQAPAEWARRGWVDFLCPMNYQTNDTTFYRYLKVQQRDAGNAVPLYPGIAAWRQESPADTISQIRRLRAENAAGYVMFHLDRRMLREWLPALSRGHHRPRHLPRPGHAVVGAGRAVDPPLTSPRPVSSNDHDGLPERPMRRATALLLLTLALSGAHAITVDEIVKGSRKVLDGVNDFTCIMTFTVRSTDMRVPPSRVRIKFKKPDKFRPGRSTATSRCCRTPTASPSATCWSGCSRTTTRRSCGSRKSTAGTPGCCSLRRRKRARRLPGTWSTSISSSTR